MGGKRRLHNHLGTSEFSLWEPIAIPLRSRFYHLAPLGMDTGLVESATGYSSRLALTHNVTLAVLFGYEIAPLLDKNHLRNSEARSNKNAVLANSFRTLAPAINGHGIVAQTYIASLQKLTMRNDLSFLTMLPWKEVISHRHLIRPKKAWCPACYDEWRGNDCDVYEPLVWSLAVVTMCIRHHRLLRSLCHSCERELSPLSSRSIPGYCTTCHAWLGESAEEAFTLKEVSANELEWQSWVNEQTYKLLATVSTLTIPLKKSTLAESISRCIRASEYRTEIAFARACGLSQSTVNDLCRGASAPQLSTLLKISFIGGVSTLDLILGRVVEAVAEMAQAEKTVIPIQHSTTSSPRNVKRSFKRLLKASPPLPMAEIEKRLNIPRSILLSRFADLCREVAANYRVHTERCRQEFWEAVREKLEKQLTEKTPLSVAKVSREAGCCRRAITKRFPNLCAQLSTHWNNRREEHWDTIEVLLRDSFKNTPPLCLKDIAKQIKVSHTSLYKYFPQLCREIAERYALHRQQTRALKKEILRNEVRKIAIVLYEQGMYPSVREVSKRLAKPRSLRSNKVALISLREIRLEYGFS